MFRLTMVCVCAAAALAGSLVARADDGRQLGVDLETAFVSQYLWRGYDVLGSHGAFQPSVTLDLFQTGFSVNAWGSFAFDDDFEDLDELDYTIAYGGVLFEEERYAIEYSVNYIYYDFPNVSSKTADAEEVGVEVALPNLLPIGSNFLVPSFYSGYLWPRHAQHTGDGWFNILGLGYDVPVPALLPGQEEQALSLAADITHNDGALGADSDWSHATASVSTSFEWKGLTLTPGLTYQWSFEDTVNDEDEFWGTLALGYVF